MRKQKTFKIEGIDKSFEVKELRVKEILGLIDDEALGDLSLPALRDLLSGRLLQLCSNIEYTELENMTPSEIGECVKHFREVNASFFVGADLLGLTEIIENLKRALLNDFSRLLANSSKLVT